MKNLIRKHISEDELVLKKIYNLYKIGSNEPIKLFKNIDKLEAFLGKTANTNLLSIQPGDVQYTYADVDDLVKYFNYRLNTSIKSCITNLVAWYRRYN
jgi:UDP-glucuronate 4-epimerase